MKRLIIKSIFAIALVGMVASCNKKLDLEPQQSVDLSTAFGTEEELEQGLIGCYAIMGGGAVYGTNYNLIAELLAYTNTSMWTGTFQSYFDIQEKQMTPSNTDVTRTWAAAYRAINLANIIRDTLVSSGGAAIVPDQADRDALIGEAEFIRAIMHFELVRFYGKQYDATTVNSLGVPIKLKGAKTEAAASEKPVRNTVGEVYNQVITDLLSAAAKLPDDNGVRADRYTAIAFLARVYLQKGDYPNALAAADAVISSGKYFPPGNDLRSPFTSKNTRENVFEIQQNDQNNAGTSNDGLATFYADTEDGIGRGDMVVDDIFVNSEYAPDDKRLEAWYYVGYQYGGTMINKWIAFGQNIPIIRIQEMLLIRAECNIRLGSSVGNDPEIDLAFINNPERTGQPVITNPTIDDIFAERRRELAFEGFAVHDIKRFKKKWGDWDWNDNMLTLPIPQRERDASQNSLEQNPGY